MKQSKENSPQSYLRELSSLFNFGRARGRTSTKHLLEFFLLCLFLEVEEVGLVRKERKDIVERENGKSTKESEVPFAFPYFELLQLTIPAQFLRDKRHHIFCSLL